MIFMGGISGVVSVIGTMFGQWLNRDKADAEAESIRAGAEKKRAEADAEAKRANTEMILAFTQTIKESVGSVKEMTKMLQFQKDLTDKRDEQIDTLTRRLLELERLVADGDSVIEAMKQDMVDMVVAGQSKDDRITALEQKRAADRERISALEKERKSLLAKIDKLRKRLENGQIMATGTQDAVVIDEKTPEIKDDGMPGGE